METLKTKVLQTATNPKTLYHLRRTYCAFIIGGALINVAVYMKKALQNEDAHALLAEQKKLIDTFEKSGISQNSPLFDLLLKKK